MKILTINFSGGRSSAIMTRLCLTDPDFNDYRKIVVFCNTGCEHENTLRFIRDCDKHWGFKTVWLELDMHNKPKFRIVDFETASRDGRPFREVIERYGIPNSAAPHCTKELKRCPERAYMKTQGFSVKKGDRRAIGIRADEIDRISPKAKKLGILYPLADRNICKSDVLYLMSQVPWDLSLPNGEADGNCVWCWKKSDRKLLTIAKSNPEHFAFPHEMEEKHSATKAFFPDGTPYAATGDDGKRHFFRDYRDSSWFIEHSSDGFREYSDESGNQLSMFCPVLDVGGGCGESCEIYGD